MKSPGSALLVPAEISLQLVDSCEVEVLARDIIDKKGKQMAVALGFVCNFRAFV